jgi:hypothetical protein
MHCAPETRNSGLTGVPQRPIHFKLRRLQCRCRNRRLFYCWEVFWLLASAPANTKSGKTELILLFTPLRLPLTEPLNRAGVSAAGKPGNLLLGAAADAGDRKLRPQACGGFPSRGKTEPFASVSDSVPALAAEVCAGKGVGGGDPIRLIPANSGFVPVNEVPRRE